MSLKNTGEFLKENGRMAAKYGDWLKGGDVESERDIAPGHGAVIMRGLRKVACYKDEKSVLHECSAVCPHLGALVRWNDNEKTWDCPAHGSRFQPTGEVFQGPSARGLKPLPNPEGSDRVTVPVSEDAVIAVGK